MSPKFIIDILYLVQLCTLSSVVAKCPMSYTIGPDTSILDDQTYYKFGYEMRKRVLEESDEDFHKYNALNGAALEELANIEMNIYNKLQNLRRRYPIQRNGYNCNDNFTRSVEEYSQDLKESSLLLLEQLQQNKNGSNVGRIVSGNPITVYRMLRRYRNFLQPWRRKSTGENLTEFQNDLRSHIRSMYKSKNGPLRMDFQISIMALVLMQFQLDMKTSDIAQGIIRRTKTGVVLQAIHCYDIGLHSVASGMYAIGIEWLELTVSKINAGDKSLDLDKALHWLKIASIKHDQNWSPVNDADLEQTFFQEPLSVTNVANASERRWIKRSLFQPRNVDSWFPYETYWKVCNGEIQLSDVEKSKLVCWLETEIHPTWKIGPLKVELLSSFPRAEVIQYHDVISDTDTQKVKANFQPKFEDSKLVVYSPFNPKLRLSATDFNAPKETRKEVDPVFEKLRRLVTVITGLQYYDDGTRDAPLQTSAFPPGGYVMLHTDGHGIDYKESRHGNRIATFVYYYDTPDQGGYTAFTHGLFRMSPVKGSAIIWYNLLSSGVFDRTSLHGVCPVELGHRWSGTTWLVYADQYHLKCDMDEKKGIETLMNGKSKHL